MVFQRFSFRRPRLGLLFAFFFLGSFLAATLISQPRAVASGSEEWQVEAPYLVDAYSIALASDTRFVYAAGGHSFSLDGTVNTFARYDPLNDSWEELNPMPLPAMAGELVYAPNVDQLFYFGGVVPGTGPVYQHTLVYDIATDDWSFGPSMPWPRHSFASGYMDGLIYIAGGYDALNASLLNDLIAFDPVGGTFDESPQNMPIALAHPGAGVIGDKLYLAGGSRSGAPLLDTLHIYDATTDSWSTGAGLFLAVTGPGSAVVDGKLWLIGGGDPARVVTQSYDPVTDSWTQGPELNHARQRVDGAALDDTLYTLGGYEYYAGTLDSFESLDLMIDPPASRQTWIPFVMR